MSLASLNVRLGADVGSLVTGLNSAIEIVGRVGDAFNRMTEKAIEAAVDADRTAKLIGMSFGKSADAVNDWADANAAAMSSSAGDLLKLAASAQMVNATLTDSVKTSSQMSMNMAGLAEDIASAFGGDAEEALRNLEAGINGNEKAVRQYKIAINDEALAAEAQREGIKMSVKDMDDASKARLRHNAIVQQTQALTGAATRDADTYTGAMRALTAANDDAAESLGKALLPALTDAVKWISEVVKKWNELNEDTSKISDLATTAVSIFKTLGVTVMQVAGYVMITFGGIADFVSSGAKSFAAAIQDIGADIDQFAANATRGLAEMVKALGRATGSKYMIQMGAELVVQAGVYQESANTQRAQAAELQKDAVENFEGTITKAGKATIELAQSASAFSDRVQDVVKPKTPGGATVPVDPKLNDEALRRAEEARRKLEEGRLNALKIQRQEEDRAEREYAAAKKAIHDREMAFLAEQQSVNAGFYKGALAAMGAASKGDVGGMFSAFSSPMSSAASTFFSNNAEFDPTKAEGQTSDRFKDIAAKIGVGAKDFGAIAGQGVSMFISFAADSAKTILTMFVDAAKQVFTSIMDSAKKVGSFLVPDQRAGGFAAGGAMLAGAAATGPAYLQSIPLLVAGLASILGAFIELAQQTKAYAEIQAIVKDGFDTWVAALEPAVRNLIPFAYALNRTLAAFAPLISAMLPWQKMGQILFEAMVAGGTAAINLAIAFEVLREHIDNTIAHLWQFRANVNSFAEGLLSSLSSLESGIANFLRSLPGGGPDNGLDEASAAAADAGAAMGRSASAAQEQADEWRRSAREAQHFREGLEQIRGELQSGTFNSAMLAGSALARALMATASAANDANEQLTNVPTGYKVALARFNATNAQGTEAVAGGMGGTGVFGGSPVSSDGRGGVIITGPVTVIANDPEKLAEQIQNVTNRKTLVQSGTMVSRGSYGLVLGNTVGV